MKSKIIEQLKLRGYTAQEAEKVLSAVTGSIVVVAKGEASGARVPGFGTFKVATSAEKQGRNPATGQSLTIPAKTQLKFKAAKDLVL